MSVEKGNELASRGQLLEAEEIYWAEIDGGDDSARLALAYAFHDVGLNSLALEHYQELRDTPHWEAAAPQISEILLDVHDYKEARNVLKGLSGQSVELSLAAIQSVEEKTSGYLNEIPGIVESALHEEQQMLQVLSDEAHLPTQIQLMQTRQYLAHYSSVLASDLASTVKEQAIEVSAATGLSVSRKLNDALGAPSRRWFEAAHATVNAFTLLMQFHPGESDDFQKMALSAMSFIEKKYVLAGRTITEDQEDFAINNLIWALNTISHPAKDFYSHLLPD